MSLRIIYGRAGSGKSQFCFEDIKAKQNENCYMITPEQFSFTAEQKLLEMLETGSSLNSEVITFGRMANRVLKEIGGVTSNILSENGKKMLLYDILSKGKETLTFLGKSEENVDLIIKTLTEMKKHCVSQEMLKQAIGNIQDERLKLKLKDVSYCYEQFQNKLGNTYIEENDVLSILPEKLEKSRMFYNSNVYIDEFAGLTLQEYDVIEVILKQAKLVTVTIASDDIKNEQEDGLFYFNNRMAQRLIEIAQKNNIKIEETIYLSNTYRFKNEELKVLEQNLYAFPEQKYKDEVKNIHISLVSNPYAEIEKVASQIVTLVKEKGYLYRDISVITKNTESYGALIKAIFRSYDIPNFIDEKKDLSQNILIRYLLSVLEILAKGWNLESVLSSIKTGFYPISEEEQYEIENYAIAWGIKGKAWYEKDWHYGIETDEEKERINVIRKKVVVPIIQLKEELGRGKTIKNICQKLYEFLKETKVGETLNKKIQELLELGEVEIANEYAASIQMVTKILDEIVLWLGDENVSFEKQLSLLKIGFSGHVLGAIPATLDQVIVGDVERSRSHKVKAVFIIGLNDGVFPSFKKEEGFLNDKDRRTLTECGMELAKDSVQNLYEEQFSIYKAFSVAEEELYLSYPSSDKEGASLRPSSLISKIKKIFPNIKEESSVVFGELSIINKKVTFENLLTALQDSNGLTKKWQAIYEIYEEDEEWKARLSAAMQGIKDTNLPVPIQEANIKKLYGNVLKTSISRLEQYRKCPFSFHLKYGLKLKEAQEFNLKAVDTGSFMHEIIAKFFDVAEEKNLDCKILSNEQIRQMVADLVREELNLSKNDLFNSTPKFQNLTRRLGKVITKAVTYIIEQLKNSEFQMAGAEIEFSNQSAYEPIRLELETGEKVEVTGKIDRIDIAKDENGKYLRIIDYKSSAKSIDFGEVLAGLQIQLLTYLDAATSLEEAIPAGVFYFGLMDTVLKAKKNKTDEEIEKELQKRFKLSGVLLADVKVVKMMDKKLEKGYSDVVPVFIDKDGQLSLSRSNVVSMEQFQDLQKHTKRMIKQISKEILSGNIAMRPYKNKAKKSACEHCSYKSICNFSPDKKGNEYFYLKNMEKQEILEKIKMEVGSQTPEVGM